MYENSKKLFLAFISTAGGLSLYDRPRFGPTQSYDDLLGLKAMRQDWVNIGKDFEKAIQSTSKEIKNSAE